MRAVRPETGEPFGAEFARSTRADLEAMADTAFDAIDFLADAPGALLAGFLEDYAARLEAECGNDVNNLDTCAAYRETQERAALALGDSTAGNVFAAHGASIRARIERLTSGEPDGEANV